MEIKFNNLQEFKIAVEAGKVEKPQFVAIRNYTNKNGETSNYLINLGTDYGKAREEDLALLAFLTPEDYEFPEDVQPFAQQAYENVLNKLRANCSENKEEHTNQSIAQSEAYETIAPNLRIHNESEKIFLYGMQIRKTVVEAGEYPQRKSRPLTIAQNIIKKNFKHGKFRQFELSKIGDIKINGKELTIEVED